MLGILLSLCYWSLWLIVLLELGVMADLCVGCKKPVRARQEAVQCDGCDRWCHRNCGTEIQMVRNEVEFDWKCYDCTLVVDKVILHIIGFNFP